MIDEPAERSGAFERLREAYIDLEAAKPLRELGRSAAFVSHEIKNYMMVISGYAALLLRSKKLDGKDRAMADNIAAAVAKLHDFSMGVLELSRPEAVGGEEEVELARLFRRCAADFAEGACGIAVDCAAPQILINGNPKKLKRLLINALRNSVEAGAKSVRVKLSVCNQMALIVIVDDGAGCSAEELPNLSKTFFTTKRGVGTGLGLCALRSIAEAHGGCVSVYAKNVLGGGKRGLSVQILLPASKKTPCEAVKAEVMLVKDGLAGTPKIMKTLKELKVIPHVIGQVGEVADDWQKSPLDVIVITAASKAEELRKLTGENEKIKVLPIEETEAGVLLAVNDDNNINNRELLTEEYIVNSLF